MTPMPKSRRSTPSSSPRSTEPVPDVSSAGLSPDTILLAVIGMSPAVLTETIWALAHEPEPVVPRRVIAVTTLEGRRQIERQLFTPYARFGDRTPWDVLRHALASAGHSVAERLRFGTTGDDIRIITTREASTGRSVELADIRTPADNEAAADFLLDQVRQIVENPDTHLVASVAGGRKTMGALLYACLTLAGRETDRLTHVLVNEPFEATPEFYFPGQPGGSLTIRGPHATLVDPGSARVELADVPFVPLRNLFKRELGRPAGTFSRLIEHCSERMREVVGEDLRLVIHQSRTDLDVDHVRVHLSPREHLILLFLAVRAKRGEPAFAMQKAAMDALNEFRVSLVSEASSKDFADWRHGDTMKSTIEDADLRKALSSLRKKLRESGGSAPRLAAALPAKGRFSLTVPGPMIHLKP